MTPEAKRAVVRFWRDGLGLSERRGCGLMGLDRSTYRYQRRADRSGELRQRLRELAEQRRGFGYRRLHVLLRREGCSVNKKRVQRLYREEGFRCAGGVARSVVPVCVWCCPGPTRPTSAGRWTS
jgi:transposase InsO family protein